MITIRKDVLSNATPQQIRDQTANLTRPRSATLPSASPRTPT